MGLTQKEKDWVVRLGNYLRENQNCRLEILNGKSGIKGIHVIFPYGKKIKDRLDTGRNNFNNKQRRIFNRLIESMYFIIFMEKALPGISLLTKELAVERLKSDKMLREVN